MLSADISSRLDAALDYARRGWAVIPLVPGGKTPLTAHGYKDGTTDEAKIRSWWAKTPSANVGIVTGAESGLVVLDVDPRNGGEITLDELIAEHGKLPDTVVAITGGGGRHIFFQHPGS